MDDLRSEIRAAFAKEQAAHPPAANLRHEVVRAAARQPRRETNWQWLAVAATVVIAVLIVVSLMSTRIAQRVAPAATPNATPTGDYGAPPAGVNLVYVADPRHAGWYIGFDWTGRPLGTVKTDQPGGILMAPDGQSFAIGLNAKGGNWQFLDRLGKPVGSSSLPGAYATMWADDNRHLCTINFDQQTFGYTLWTELPGEAAKPVTVVARDSSIGQSSVGLAACSIRNDSAIAVRTVIAWPSEYWVIKLSTGKVVAHRMMPGSSVSNLVGSGDATLLAENSSRSTGQEGGAASSARTPDTSGASTTIVRVSDGSVVARLDPSMGVLGFSGDNSVALVTLTPWIGGQPVHLGVVELSSGKVVWQDEGTAVFGGFVTEPGGRGFALSYPVSGQPGPGPATILIVSGDGAWTKLGAYAPTW